MATQNDHGPATGTADYFFGNTASIEFHSPTGYNSLSLIDAPIVGPSNPSGITPIQTSHVGVKFTIPA